MQIFGFSNKQPIKKVVEPEPTVVSVAIDRVQNQAGFRQLLIKPVLNGFKWVEAAGKELSAPAKEIKVLFGRVEKFFGNYFKVFNFPDKLRKVANGIIQIKSAILAGSLWDLGDHSTELFINGTGTVSVLADGAMIVNDKGWIALSGFQLACIETLGFLGSVAMFIGAVKGIGKEWHHFMNEDIGSPKFNLALMKVIGKVCLIALSVFAMITFLQGLMVEKIILLAISTILLAFSIGSHFYEKLVVDISKKPVEI